MKKKKGERKPKSRLKSLESKLDKIFSLYIRLRDSQPYDGKYFRCPTCGRVLPFEQADCSHYFSRRNNSTRWDEDNCLAECRYDNRFNAEHLHKLKDGVVSRIGEQRFTLLEWKHNQPKKWTEFEIEVLIDHYKLEVKRLKSEKGL